MEHAAKNSYSSYSFHKYSLWIIIETFVDLVKITPFVVIEKVSLREFAGHAYMYIVHTVKKKQILISEAIHSAMQSISVLVSRDSFGLALGSACKLYSRTAEVVII